jgi:hypothetical protein
MVKDLRIGRLALMPTCWQASLPACGHQVQTFNANKLSDLQQCCQVISDAVIPIRMLIR